MIQLKNPINIQKTLLYCLKNLIELNSILRLISKIKRGIYMKTLLIGDLHLKSQLILPIVDRIIQTHNIKRVIFLGDYVDLHGQTKNI